MKNGVLVLGIALLSGLSFSYAKDIDAKIVGGVEASVGEFPYIVSLQRSGSHFCGGSLIKQNWVLTAAHCVQGKIDKVIIGLHDRTDQKNAEVIKPSKIVAHPKYNSTTTDYDFALIQLSSNSKYTPVKINIDEIDIPEKDAGEIISTTAGWGTTSEGASTLPKMLQKVDVPLVTHNACDKAYSNKITDRMICAGLDAGGKDSCQGDSGGPLIVKDVNNEPNLVGVVSWGYGCARPNLYGVYSKVNSVHAWIETTAVR